MKSLLFALGFVALAATAAEADTAYSCVFNQAKMAEAGKYNLVILVDSQTGKASVSDGLANNKQNDPRHKTPAVVDVKRMSDGSQVFSWTEEEVRFDSYSSDVSWRVQIEQNGAIDATYSVISYAVSRHYVGTCKIEKGKFKFN